MKLSKIFPGVLFAVAAAQPHHRHQHQRHAYRRDVVVDTVTDYVTAAAAVVYVNQNGQPVSTSYVNAEASSTAVPSPVDSTTSSSSAAPSIYISPSATTSNSWSQESSFITPAPQSSSASVPAPSSASSSASASESSLPSSSSGTNIGSLGYGISYSPYNNDGSCKNQDQVNADFNAFSDYGFIRSYGVDCDQATTILNAATSKGMKIIGGIYDINNVGPETQQFIDAAQNKWDAVDTVVVGNEAVTDGMATVEQVVSAVNQARSMLRAAGYNGKVVTVDTSEQVIDNPALCQASDFAAANCHAFFNADMTPDGAGSWVKDQAERVSDACGGQPAMIMESGWPSQGETNGLAVPSQANQQTAIASLRNAFSSNIVLFSAFNDYWKQNTPSTFDAEQYWGIYGNAPS